MTKEMHRRLARLESERADGGAGVEHGLTPEEYAEIQTAAHAKITEFLNTVSAEKAAGDVHGIADRQIARALAALERQA